MMNKERKVLIIVENLPVPFDTRVWQEATTLAAKGYTVSVICPKGKGYTQEEEYLQNVHIFRHDLPVEGNGAVGYAKEYLTKHNQSVNQRLKGLILNLLYNYGRQKYGCIFHQLHVCSCTG